MRLLITGSREWTDEEKLREELQAAWVELAWPLPVSPFIPGDVTLVHGDCREGADRLADETWAHNVGPDSIERHPADWKRHDEGCPPSHDGARICKRAGFRRNAEMVALGADLCLAFIRDGSRGATHCAVLAEKAGIPTRRYLA
ncbi:SLOG family protein [Nocardioides speluncae]|uniref:SLOG family protein n=1 Tax=Nocardioides speluncae TaxID=2670337 RepID=UPI000D68C913|nr:SLOG family protein [Nocardioides speluncae]